MKYTLSKAKKHFISLHFSCFFFSVRFPYFVHLIKEQTNRLKLHFQRVKALLSWNTSMNITFMKRLLECQQQDRYKALRNGVEALMYTGRWNMTGLNEIKWGDNWSKACIQMDFQNLNILWKKICGSLKKISVFQLLTENVQLSLQKHKLKKYTLILFSFAPF